METVSRVNDQDCLCALLSIKHSAHFKEVYTILYYTLHVVINVPSDLPYYFSHLLFGLYCMLNNALLKMSVPELLEPMHMLP